jgi:hypothetical protein
MSNDFDDSLREALRPIDPGDTFTQRVLSRVESKPTPVARMTAQRWLMAATVAAVALGAVFAHEWQVRRTQRGLKARQELIEALRMTGEKLDLAYRVVNEKEERSAAPEDSGA